MYLAKLCSLLWSRRQESNLDLSLRRAEFYPLKYSGNGSEICSKFAPNEE